MDKYSKNKGNINPMKTTKAQFTVLNSSNSVTSGVAKRCYTQLRRPGRLYRAPEQTVLSSRHLTGKQERMKLLPLASIAVRWAVVTPEKRI